MADSVYKVIEVIGASPESWERAATNAVERASKTLRDLRVAEIAQLDMQVSNGKVEPIGPRSSFHSSSKTDGRAERARGIVSAYSAK